MERDCEEGQRQEVTTSKRSAGWHWLKLRGKLKREQGRDGSYRGQRLFGNKLPVYDDDVFMVGNFPI